MDLGQESKLIKHLALATIVISSKKGIEGINLKKTNPPFITDGDKNFINKILNVIKNNKKFKSKSNNLKKFYLENYSMKNILKKFINENEI